MYTGVYIYEFFSFLRRLDGRIYNRNIFSRLTRFLKAGMEHRTVMESGRKPLGGLVGGKWDR